MKDYTFFSYETNEALHLSEQERQTVIDCFQKIRIELKHALDKHSKMLIASNIELLLNTYFNSDKPQTIGLPSVKHWADQLNLSSNYFGDLIKKETG